MSEKSWLHRLQQSITGTSRALPPDSCVWCSAVNSILCSYTFQLKLIFLKLIENSRKGPERFWSFWNVQALLRPTSLWMGFPLSTHWAWQESWIKKNPRVGPCWRVTQKDDWFLRHQWPQLQSTREWIVFCNIPPLSPIETNSLPACPGSPGCWKCSVLMRASAILSNCPVWHSAKCQKRFALWQKPPIDLHSAPVSSRGKMFHRFVSITMTILTLFLSEGWSRRLSLCLTWTSRRVSSVGPCLCMCVCLCVCVCVFAVMIEDGWDTK